jgi:transposase-like protein
MTTVKLARWEKHVAAARRQGMPLSHYAREHGISRYTLYAAQRQLRHNGEVTAKRSARQARARPSAAPFVAVRIAGSAPAAVRARLPNGVQLEFGHLDPGACATLVGMLAALPCSG